MGRTAVACLLAPVLAGTVSLAGPARAAELRTNLGRTLVPLEEIRPGGPPPDGIPAIDRPTFVSPSAADAWLAPAEPVLALEIEGDARAYAVQILVWHEIVNDTVGGVPVTVTFCPLCNAGMVFDRRVGGRVLDFGTSGKLYRSDLVMYDRQTHSLWAQMEGRAVVGDLAGTRLALIPANTIAYSDWKAAHPGGRVLSTATGHGRDYGRNPYEGYDAPASVPFLFEGALDRRLPPKERVVGITVADLARAYPFSVLLRRRVVSDTVGIQPVVVFHRSGMRSALDQARIAESREVGATGVFDPRIDGRALTFEASDHDFRDRETGTTWSLLGRGLRGPLTGRRLRPIPHVDAFWFAWAAFHPTTTTYPGR